MFAHISQRISIKAVCTETTEITSRYLLLNADRHRSKHFFSGIAEEDEKILEASCQANNQVMNARKRLNSVHRLERLPVKSIKSF